MTNRCKATEGAQQCIRAARHPKVKGHTLGPRGETKEWNADGTPRTVETEAIERRSPARDAAWFEPSPDAPTITIPSPARLALLPGGDLLLTELDQAVDEHDRVMSDRPLLDLALAELDYQITQLDQVGIRFVDEIYQRLRFLDFAEAAQVAGHHPAAAYCYAADRFDPAVMA